MKVLLAEPYFGGSHRAWAEGYRDHSSHDVTLITLPARWWKWRMRGGAVTLAETADQLAQDGYRPDVVLASSMIDLSLLRVLLDDIWGRLPTALYLHETQLTYPDSPLTQPDLSYGFTNWSSALVADRVFFNSGYHHDVFFDEVRRFLRGFPEHTHEHRIDEVRAKSEVLPVGVDLSWLGDRPEDAEPPLVMWNHRWEHDKDPGAFADAVRSVADTGADFQLALCGEVFQQRPAELSRLVRELGDRVIHAGFAPRDDYRRLLSRSSVVVSTTIQEFFGVSVVEAVAAGAFPVLPNRLSYPWLIPEEFHSGVLYDDEHLVRALQRALGMGGAPEDLRRAMRRFDWSETAGRYDSRMERLSAQPD